LILEVEYSRVESGVKEGNRGPESYGERAKADRRSRHGGYTFQSAKDHQDRHYGLPEAKLPISIVELVPFTILYGNCTSCTSLAIDVLLIHQQLRSTCIHPFPGPLQEIEMLCILGGFSLIPLPLRRSTFGWRIRFRASRFRSRRVYPTDTK
jgi:hypothetical protein